MFDYGKYTPYVLTCYGIAVVVLVGVTLWSILRVINAKKKLDQLEGKGEKAP
jgi:heme exporter protein CcmD